MKQDASQAVIEVRDVVHTFGEVDDPRRVLALDHLSQTINHRELVCFIEPSGCGKSTMLGGLTQPRKAKSPAYKISIVNCASGRQFHGSQKAPGVLVGGVPKSRPLPSLECVWA